MEEKKFHKKRFFLYIAAKILMVLLVILVAWFAFNSAKDTFNIQVMLKDGMTQRMSVVLKGNDGEKEGVLRRLFTEEYLEKSGILNTRNDAAYDIESFNQAVSVDFKIVLAWRNRVTITVKDLLISADITGDDAEKPSVDDIYESGLYDIDLVRQDGQWKINDIRLKERILMAEEENQSE